MNFKYLNDDEGCQWLSEAVLGRLIQAPDPRDEGLPVGARHGDPQHQLEEPASKYYPESSLCDGRILSSDKCAQSTIVMLPCVINKAWPAAEVTNQVQIAPNLAWPNIFDSRKPKWRSSPLISLWSEHVLLVSKYHLRPPPLTRPCTKLAHHRWLLTTHPCSPHDAECTMTMTHPLPPPWPWHAASHKLEHFFTPPAHQNTFVDTDRASMMTSSFICRSSSG